MIESNVFCLDCETSPIPPVSSGKRPEFVVLGWVANDGRFEYTTSIADAWARVGQAISERNVLVGHNIAFDLEVLDVVPAETALIHDTMLAHCLQELATNDCYGDHGPPAMPRLDSLAGPIAGKGTTQLSFVPGHPPTQEQLAYLERDVRATLTVYNRQAGKVPGGLGEMNLQVRAALALRRLERTGLHVDQAALERQEVIHLALKHKAAMELKQAGIYNPAWTGKKGGEHKEKLSLAPLRAHVVAVCEKLGVEVQQTDKGSVSTDHEFLLELQSDPLVAAFSAYKDAEKMVGTFLHAWKNDNCRVYASYRLLMRTGRTSCHKPNFQQVPSRGERGAIKSVFIAPEGREFYELDYGQLELCTLAYWTRGALFEKINAGVDVHRYLGAVYFRKPMDEVTKDERQLMKAANFGLPGGMGANKFRSWIRKNGLPDPGKVGARDLINAWLAAFPEMTRWLEDDCPIPRQYRDVWAGRKDDYTDQEIAAAWQFAWNNLPAQRLPAELYHDLRDQKGSPNLEVWLTHRNVIVSGGRKRCPVSYTEQRNTKFQGLAANLTKTALAAVVLGGPPSCQVHAFIHDSLLISVPIGYTDEVDWVARLMLAAGDRWIPGVRLGLEICGPGQNWWAAKTGASRKVLKM